MDESEQEQLAAVECDLPELIELIGLDETLIFDFANSNPPRRRFLVGEKLSVTISAAVYIAIDCTANRPVVLKISQSPIEPEGRLVALAAHPNVVTLYDVLVCEGRPTMVLEWCSQGSLADYAFGADEWAPVLARGLEAGRGLAHCHMQGLVHGDVKPTNILVADEVGKLSDFGLARPETDQDPFAGSLGYVPPERDDGIWNFAGDVYSYAVTLEHALRSFEVPQVLKDLLDAAAAEDPADRPSLAKLLADLEQIEANETQLQLRELERQREAHEREREEHERERQRLEHERCERERERVGLERVRRDLEKRWRRVHLMVAAACTLAVVTLGSVGLAAKCMVKREPSIEVTLELASESVEAGDGEAAVKYLEAARLTARRDFDKRAMALVAAQAEELGHSLVEQADDVHAAESWGIAQGIFLELGDQAAVVRVKQHARELSWR